MTAQVSVGERAAFSVTDFFVRYGVVLVGLLVAIVFSVVIPGFATVDNAVSILQTQAVAAIAALGMTLTAIVGDLDLSVGAVAGLSVTVAAVVMIRFALTGPTAIVACLIAGAVVGCVNAILIVWLSVPPLLATLGTMFTVQGLKRWLVDGQTLITGMTLPDGTRVEGRFTDDFAAIDGTQVLGIPLSVYLFVLIAVLAWVFLERTRYGRVFYAVGGNAEAARLAGARVRRYQFTAYAISGVLAAIAGIILASRLRQGDVTAGDSALLDAVAMTLVGYAVLGAKKPNALGTVIGAVFIGLILQGLTQLGLPYYTQDLIKGLVLIFALLMSFSLRRRRRRFAAH
ncbi:ABC transporter permease [Pseudonocardia asaccharolytica]|uniref:ABC transporter n=1 Tax=Pseudonocardia asaccharolytica DSM 44247 = NBRC 16224 TaxID=1123024 RepID=A0A511D5P5_9PSEU|nr:ABC transporter permease [Pseudonocardia asaccharolytica]GEL20116.1 ABC transporter [Pseudonocardia asaccharolytica DSM 44247 = NBRC 16224]